MQLKAAKEILDKKLSVRETERLVKRLQKEASGEKKEETTDDKTKSHVKERRFGSFMRSMTLPEDADAEHISASSKDGVLTISIPRKAPEKPQARTITVQKAE